MQIIKFEPKYRDDLIFMILEAKNALGRVNFFCEILTRKGDWFIMLSYSGKCFSTANLYEDPPRFAARSREAENEQS